MILRSPDRSLPPRVRAVLSRWQREIDGEASYPERVAAARESWKRRNHKGNKTFDAVKDELRDMCTGPRRCGYCEDSCAYEIEHVWPRSLYPERTYVWENLLYACGPCNGPKSNQFAVITDGDVFVDVTRKRRAPVVPPRTGRPVLVDPRTEDPLHFFQLDILGTFWFLPRGVKGELDFRRAEETIKILGLNVRDHLVEARKDAFRSYRARLREYIAERDEGRAQRSLQRLVRNLKRMGHPFVWAEMKRSGHHRDDLRELFRKAPEALEW